MTRWLRDGETALASASVAAGQLTRTGHNIEQRMGMGGRGAENHCQKNGTLSGQIKILRPLL